MSYARRMAQRSPGWLQTSYGLSWMAGIGGGLDSILDGYKDAIKARFPEYAATNGDDYALAQIGADSSLPRYPNETDTQYGTRLKNRWDRYDRAGAAERASDGSGCPIVEDAEGIGFGDVRLMEYRDYPADGVNPNVHHSPEPWYDNAGILGIMLLGVGTLGSPWWSRFWLYVGTYNGGNIPSGGVLGVEVLGTMVLGFDLSSEAVMGAIKSGLQWKPAHVRFEGLYVLTDGTPTASVLGIGSLFSMILGASGSGPGYAVIDVRS